jgi:Predicted nuclease (RecB family)
VNDFAAYERQTRRLLEAAIGADPAAEVYPEPVEHCAICRWRDMCRERRRTDDDLSLVAGMTTGQRRALKGDGISTRRGFAGLAELPRLDRVSPDVLGAPSGRPACRWPARTTGSSGTSSGIPNATPTAP